ncbi:MAG TPA: ABC transporter permease [Bauldia sp.]|nr:ABC transporter permease [Bauldia sp.]
MIRVVLWRLALVAGTLLLVSIMVFALSDVLQGDPGRAILGKFATAEQVAQVDRELGADRPLVERYVDWAGGFVRGDWGKSYVMRVPVFPLVMERLGKSLLLAILGILFTLPISIALGVLAATRRGSWVDHTISVAGLALVSIPEFVSGTFCLIVFGVWLRWFPVSALAPDGAGFWDQIYRLVLPAVPVALLLFGYIARMTRSAMIEALESDYVRTALLKGLPGSTVILRHALPNALLPTISVVGTQFGLLIGGLVVLEVLFNYPGIGRLILDSALAHDLPVLGPAVLAVSVVFMACSLIADALFYILNPRSRRQAA